MTRLNIPPQFPTELLGQIPGFKVVGGELHYPGPASEARAALEKAFEGKKFIETRAKAYKPDESDMALAKSHFGDENFAVDKIGFRRLETANTLKDRDDDILDKSFLDELARQVNDESRVILMYHDSRAVVGRKFRAEVVARQFPNGQTGWQLVEYAYFLKDYQTDGGVSLAEKLDSGALQDVSIGFYGSGRRYDEGQKARTFYHQPGVTQTENMETSFVHMGAQYYSRVGKSIKEFTQIIDNPNVNKMDKVNITIGQEVKTLTTEADIQKEFSAVQSAAKTAAAELAAEKAKTADLQKQVDSLKEPLVNNIVNREKELKCTVWTEDELKGFTLDKLSKMSADLDARYKAANPGLNDDGTEKATGKTTNGAEKSAAEIIKQLETK